jgi:predicted DNA-binding transcriptional regulator YafY
MKRTERLFALAEHLRSRRSGITAGELAERFGVTVRTVHRDLDALRNADMPISSERGRGGGFALDAHYTLPPVNISAREAAVLLILTKYAKEMRLLPFYATLESASSKVRAALSASGQRELARRLDELGFVGVPAKPVASRTVSAIERAWFEQSTLKITYPFHNARHADPTPLSIKVRSFVFDRSETRVNVTDDNGIERQLRLDKITLT